MSILIETWHSDLNEEEKHYFLNNKDGTYLFGINSKLIPKETIDEVWRILQASMKLEDLEIIQKK